ncbi:hypothetical protein [Qipengyuania vesicularis]|uniref:hypothetical protein n=1 Tax=Qipengyuania vesicularis TaxID=2867232 RepID=UPI001C87FFF2|nr:hypothetical protein [Qipengyuania vesicularis]MBX7526686.1 hypothetical protein [Qipengyuania vesicularis]
MRKTFLYLLAGQLASISIPIMAQESNELSDQLGETALTAEQLATIEAWPPEKQVEFRAWSADTQVYFWTLPPQRQAIFWKLRDEDKSALAGMDDIAREEAWLMIEQKTTGKSDHPATDEKREPDEMPQSEGR